MIRNFLSDVDDWLIDSVFQPICDWLRKTFGWSKKVPTALCYLASVAGAVPLIALVIRLGGGSAVFLLVGACLFGIYMAYCLIIDEINGSKGLPSFLLDSARINGKRSRVIGIPIFFLFVIPALPLVMIVGEGVVTAAIFSLIAAYCKHFFEACTDFPKGKKVQVKKTVLQS